MQDLLAHTADLAMQERFTTQAIEKVVEHGGLQIPASSIQSARLRAGIVIGGLSLVMRDGHSITLL